MAVVTCPHCGQEADRAQPICPHCLGLLTLGRHTRSRAPKTRDTIAEVASSELEPIDPGGPGGAAPTGVVPTVGAVNTVDVRCADPTCGTSNAVGATTCIRCNAPLPRGAGQAATPISRPALLFPWGVVEVDLVIMATVSALRVGRDPDWSPIAGQLEPYPNISRQHAEVLVEPEGVRVRDLASTNGTFVNSVKLAPSQVSPLCEGDVVRFAAHLSAVVSMSGGRK